MLSFENIEDRKYFEDLLCQEGEVLEDYAFLFDFRDAHVKRREFNNARDRIFDDMMAPEGAKCSLQYPGICDIHSGWTIDHIIPLSSNILNKTLRDITPEKGKKVPSQSIGSNHRKNLITACRNCNNHKKHRFLDKDKIKNLLAQQ